jgi:hypothetical protein
MVNGGLNTVDTPPPTVIRRTKDKRNSHFNSKLNPNDIMLVFAMELMWISRMAPRVIAKENKHFRLYYSTEAEWI